MTRGCVGVEETYEGGASRRPFSFAKRPQVNISWQGEGPMPLDRGCVDTPAGPLDVPLHPVAEAFWRSQGYL